MGIFEGYTKTPHNYPVYFPYLRMEVLKRDVKFDERKAMRCSLERDLQLWHDQEILALKEEFQEVVEKPQKEEKGVKTTT